jgi:hypothetical protein
MRHLRIRCALQARLDHRAPPHRRILLSARSGDDVSRYVGVDTDPKPAVGAQLALLAGSVPKFN